MIDSHVKVLYFLSILSTARCINSLEVVEVPTLYVTIKANPYYWRGRQPVEENNTVIRLEENSDYLFDHDMRSATLICNATYPITWLFHNNEQSGHASWLINIRMKRSSTILYDPSTYVYLTELGLYGDYNRLTGNYSCMSTTKTFLHNSVHVYWEGSSPPFLLQAGENRTVCVQDVVNLPCAVSTTHVTASLFKETSQGFQYLNVNGSISFNPKNGFTLSNLPDLVGSYKCIVDSKFSGSTVFSGALLKSTPEKNGDAVRIKVEKCNDTITVAVKKSNATFTYNSEKGQLICCSSTFRAPKMFHFYCHHPIMCSFRQDFDSYFLRNFFGRKRSRKGCSVYKVYIHSPGVARCIGDGIDATVEYAFPLVVDYSIGKNISHIPIYWNWNEIPAVEMMVVQQNHPYYGRYGAQPQTTAIIYEAQVIQLFCHLSPYYFSEGIHWAVKYTNNTLQYLRDTANNGPGYGYYEWTYNPLNLKIHIDMESIICIAPVWNSTEYVHKPFHLYVNKSIAPELVDAEEEMLTWVLNDTNKKIKCQAKGLPTPNLAWAFSDSTHTTFLHVQNTSYRDVLSDNFIISETLKIPRVSYSTKGTYNCTASNFGGMAFRVIHVDVEEPPSWKTQLAVIVGVIFVVTLSAAIIFLYWRMRVETKTVQQLSVISFQDSVTRAEALRRASTGDIIASSLSAGTYFHDPPVANNLID